MTNRDRRDFLKKSAAAAAALGITATDSAAERNAEAAGRRGPADPDPTTTPITTSAAHAQSSSAATLRAIGAAVLPTADLGDAGVERVVAGFEAWIEGFEPVAEMPHGYLSRGLAEINYGPPHPGPRWASQVEALQLEAEKRYGTDFLTLPVDQRRALIEGQLERGEYDRLPSPAQARHVALGLLAFFYDGSEATDLCYRAAIGRHMCRGLSGLGNEPQPLIGNQPSQSSPGTRARDSTATEGS
jgi:hypothetical protein